MLKCKDLPIRLVDYWLRGEIIQNYGDFLSEYLCLKLFTDDVIHTYPTHLIGSVLSDYWVSKDPPNNDTLRSGNFKKKVFWGCGMRSPTSLSDDAKKESLILSVRGPLTHCALNLDPTIPYGDPALLLPALHKKQKINGFVGKNLLVPHFFDTRADSELLALSGCDLILRPNITNSATSIEQFINQLTSAKFVLAGALHAAITAAAYGIPFAYWDSEQIDIPFKWHDFSQSVNIACEFHKNIALAESFYHSDIASNIKVPPMLPMLRVAPFSVRCLVSARVIKLDIKNYGVKCITFMHTKISN